MKRGRVLTLAIALLVIVVLAGCTTFVSSDTEPDPELLLEDALSGSEASELIGERSVVFEDSARNYTTTERVWIRPPAEERTELLESEGIEGATPGDVTIQNATTFWRVFDDGEEIERYDIEPTNERTPESDTDVAKDLEQYSISYEGTDTVANRSVHVIEYEPKDETVETGIGFLVGDTQYVYPLETAATPETDFQGGTLWIDTEQHYPLKTQERYTDPDGTTLEVTSTFESVTFDVEIGDEKFEPPATETQPDESTPPAEDEPAITGYVEFDDRANAEEQIPFTLPEATFPDFERVELAADGFDGVVTAHKTYESDEHLLWFSVSDGDLRGEDPDAEGVGPMNATVETAYDLTLVTWDCGELTYQLSSELGEETLLEFAASVGCQ
ncbi:hypothetical protein OB919_21060 [Halobacteria archaeon AArc-curdl1]|uniref:Outer membrane lipoprotein carrier protein LolA n=1 Tax=Natronosalvus hydrolyticus TaxID=2979988 RepID=A0AAP2ZBX4_9EURY|nr:hypothetical protein [Halobacteria archaeon AArc-curdl1]